MSTQPPVRFARPMKSMQPELQVRKILGRTYLNENRLAEALDIFTKILMDYPDDLETLLILGGFYLAGGDGKTAKSIYLRAQQLDPQNQAIARQIVMAEELEDSGSAEPVPTDLEAVARLLQRLTGGTRGVQEKDILRAAQLLEKIIHSENPAGLISNHLDEIDSLLLALIEVNIRQAHADGRLEVAEALRNLQLNIDYQLTTREDAKPVFDDRTASNHAIFQGDLLMLLPDLEQKSKRMALLSPALGSLGCRVNEKDDYVPGRDPKPEVVIAGNPHTNPALLESLSALSAAGIPIILDLDSDFEHLPVSHREYDTKGLGTHALSNAYTAALSLADIVSVPSEEQAASLQGPDAPGLRDPRRLVPPEPALGEGSGSSRHDQPRLGRMRSGRSTRRLDDDPSFPGTDRPRVFQHPHCHHRRFPSLPPLRRFAGTQTPVPADGGARGISPSSQPARCAGSSPPQRPL
ncbi:MAG: hypothetical protein HND47_07330 [Chloroflexi bacterium]|nr:hypothetical protein [Chloroflexota bacterium]